MHVGIFSTPEEASRIASDIIVSRFSALESPNLGIATGSTPDLLYAHLRKAHREGKFSLEHSHAFALDEYVGIEANHPERYRNVLRRNFLEDGGTGLSEEGLHTPDALAQDPHEAARIYDESIKEHGGVEIQILGIGSDGHIGFNEPGGSLSSRTHVEALSRQTIDDNSRFFDNDPSRVPTRCITQGLGTIMEARTLLMLAFGEGKSEAVYNLVEGPISAKWPATIMQMHQDVIVLLDEAAASKLALRDLYRERWDITFPHYQQA